MSARMSISLDNVSGKIVQAASGFTFRRPLGGSRRSAGAMGWRELTRPGDAVLREGVPLLQAWTVSESGEVCPSGLTRTPVGGKNTLTDFAFPMRRVGRPGMPGGKSESPRVQAAAIQRNLKRYCVTRAFARVGGE
jgi:hypothetical protein